INPSFLTSVAGGTPVQVITYDLVNILMWGKNTIALENCLFVPDIVINLISAGELDLKGYVLRSEKSSFIVTQDGRTALKGKINNGLYY
ncbi:hypothetical protein VP01_9751g1, partial [Puccinia sorghi]